MNLNRMFEKLDKTILLESLDMLHNAFSVYDRELRLVYANETYCRDMQIADLSEALGKTLTEIMSAGGVKVIDMEENREHLSLPAVLKYGETFVDKEVKLVNDSVPGNAKMMMFDMFPIIDDDGKIKGAVEVSHSRHSDMKRVKKYIDFAAPYTFDDILGESPAIKGKIREGVYFADSSFNLHIYGETGVGKELFASAIHNACSKRQGPFVAINCAAFPENLFESELFGYVSGAFTGASKSGQVSKFELADGGTLFLDEIGEMPLQAQAKLLRVLETNTVTRVGSSTPVPFDTRIISATNRELERMVEEGTFRQDLYYRLQVLNLEIPPLRSRGEDVLILADHFLEGIAEQSGAKKKEISPEAEEEMLRYDWPGNVRELKNTMSRAAVFARSGIIRAEDIKAAIFAKGRDSSASNRDAGFVGTERVSRYASPEERIRARQKDVDEANINLLKDAMEIARGNKREAAELLGVSRKTVYNMLHRYGLDV